MNQKEFLVEHGKVLDTIRDITAKKNADYSQDNDAFANFKMVEQFQITDIKSGILVRLCDKMARVCNLVKQQARVKDESITDTLIDLANYSIILATYIKTEDIKKVVKKRKERITKKVVSETSPGH